MCEIKATSLPRCLFWLTKRILGAHLKSVALHLLSHPHSMEKIRGWVWEWRRGFEGNECGAVPSVFISSRLTLLHPVWFHYHDSLARTRVTKARRLEGGMAELRREVSFVTLDIYWPVFTVGNKKGKRAGCPSEKRRSSHRWAVGPSNQSMTYFVSSWGFGLDLHKS